MLREAELSLPAFVRMLANGMGPERSVSVLQTLHSVGCGNSTWLSRTRMCSPRDDQMASPELLERTDAFLAAEARDPGLVRVLTERRDIVTRALRSRALAAVSGPGQP